MAKKKIIQRGRISSSHDPGKAKTGDIRRQNIAAGIFLILAVLIVFGQAARFGFVNYDDDTYIYENPVVQKGLTLPGTVWAFTYGQIGHWHPLTWLTHMADCQMYGLWAGGHHMTSITLHALAAVFLFLGLRNMTGKAWRSAFVAAVFAVHPLRAESVVWIAERKDVLSGFFFTLTLWSYAGYVREPSRKRYALVMLWFGLGLLSKDMLMTVPFVLLLLDWWPLNRMKPAAAGVGGANPKNSDVSFWRLLKEKIPLFLLSLGSCVATVMAPEKIPGQYHISIWLRIANAVLSYVTYLRQMVFPAGLAIPYPNAPASLPLWEVGMAFGLLVAISAGAFFYRKKQPFLLMGWLWYLGMLVPVIGIIQISMYAAHADRYTYLPEIGLAMAATWAVAEGTVRWKYRRHILGGLMAMVTGTLMVLAGVQTSYWKDSETLWTRALAETTGNSLASYNMGNALHDRGRLDEAVAYYQKTLEMNPSHAQAECNLGSVLLEQGQPDKAITCFQKTLAIQPDQTEQAKAWYGLGNALMQEGQTNQAIENFQRALKVQPDYAKAHYGLANAQFDSGHLDEAVDQYQKALEIAPDFPEARFNLGNALFSLGHFDEAVIHYQKVLALKPHYIGARNNLGAALMRAGRPAEAMVEYRKALEIQPGDIEALNNLAWVLATCPQASLRDGAKAVELAQQAGQLAGGADPLILRTLAAAKAETGSFGEAMTAAHQALQLATAQGNTALGDTLEKEIQLYEAGQPVREAKP